MRNRIQSWDGKLLSRAGKQAWKFLTKPYSLVSRVYKARSILSQDSLDPDLANEKISSLFVVGEKARDVDVVKDLFDEEVVVNILGILLSNSVTKDYWY
uniref:Uncharacterized protein n=1 Tax=Cannabis sativa TaxID=3483 RepID=A0A803Q7U4_CANSA